MGSSQPWQAPITLTASASVELGQPSRRPASLPPVVIPVSIQPNKPVKPANPRKKSKTSPPKTTTATPVVQTSHAPPIASLASRENPPLNKHSDELTEIPQSSPTAAPINRPLRWLVTSIIILVVALFTQDAYDFLHHQWQTHYLLGLFFAAVLATLSGAILAMVWREFSRLKQLRTLTSLRQESDHMVTCQTFGSANTLLNRISKLYQDRQEIAPGLQTYHNQVDDYLGDQELLTLYSQHVMADIDQQAYQVIVRHASAAALMTALSPMAWLDALLFIWRNVWMVREIAEVYGVRPGATGSLVLMRQAARGMMGAGITEIVASNAMGDSVTSMVLAKAGQGLANGLFIARIGVQTMNYCRPLPFREQEKPSLGQIRKALLHALKENKNQPKPSHNAS